MIPLRRLALAFALLVLPALAQARDRLTVALQLEPPTLDPTSGAAAAVDEVTYHTIFEGLVTLAADGEVHPLLATSWTISPDGLAYTFRLRPGIRFSDGEPMDARAVAFSLERAGTPGSTNAQAQALGNIAGIDRLDPLTVRVRLKAVDYGFLTLLSTGDAAIVSRRSAAQLATRPVGTGPFMLRDWRRGDALTLVRDDHYWGRPARLAAVTFRFIADPTAAYAAMAAHDADLFVDYPSPETYALLGRDPRLSLWPGPTESEVILAMNERSGPLADIRVRRAIAMAIDRRALIDGAMAGYGTPIGSHFPPQSPDYLDLTGLSPHDPAAARRLLAAAGYPHGVPLTLDLPPPAYARRGGEIIAAELAAVGIHATIRPIEWADWLDRVFTRHAFELTIVAHAEPFDYEIYGRPDYYFGYRNPAFDRLLADLKATGDPVRRHALLGAIQRRLAEDAPNAFLFEYPRLGVADRALQDVWINTPNQAIDLAAAHFQGSGDVRGSSGAGNPGRGIAPAVLLAGGLLLIAAGWRLGAAWFARRLAVLALTLVSASLLIFLLVQVVPGDPAAAMMGVNATPAALATLHAELGLEGSAAARYLRWLREVAFGGFGLSYTYRVPVGGLLAERLAVSLPLAAGATLLSVAIGVPAGVLAAARRGRWTGRLIGGAARLGVALPSFWLAILLVLLFSVRLGMLPAGGFPGWGDPGAALAALLLPTWALGLPQAAILTRITRTAMLDQIATDHVQAARARGLSHRRALLCHALPNATGPVLAVLGLQMPFLVAGSAIVEAIFFLPGLGRLILQAIAQRDLIVVQGAALLLVAATVLASFAADLAHAALDPRLRR